MQKPVSLIRLYLAFLVFVATVFGDLPINSLPRPMTRGILLKFSSRTFIISDSTFKSSIHIESILLYGEI